METTQTIQEFINEGIKKFGASHFYKNLTDKDNYDVNSRKIFDLVVNDVRNKIKPNIISTIDDLAKLLDGNEYGEEYSNEYDINIETLCRDKNWVIIFPQSDDLLEVRGAINNEFDAWNGTFIEYCKANSFYLDDPDEETYKKAPENMFNVHVDNNEYTSPIVVSSEFSPEGLNQSWLLSFTIQKDVKYSTFTIMEDNDVYSNAFIFDLTTV